MNRLWMSGAAAVMAMSIASVGAQTPQTPQTQPPAQPPQAQEPAQQPAVTAEQNTTVQGCVYEEKDVPGRTPNVAERAGVLEDYILVVAAPAEGATAGTSGSMASVSGKAFKLEHAADERLKEVVGKRVEVTGRVDAKEVAGTSGVKPDTNPGSPDKIELPEFEVSSIKVVEGTCPATPAIGR